MESSARRAARGALLSVAERLRRNESLRSPCESAAERLHSVKSSPACESNEFGKAEIVHTVPV